MKHFLLAAAMLLSTGLTAEAQWSEDPEVNNRISPNNVGFYDPCYLTNADGVTYYFFLVPNQLDGYDRMQSRLQIYDAEGRRQLGATGKVVCNERNITWTKFNDYTILDNDGNLILVAYDLRQSAADKYDFAFSVYKLSPQGEMLWSAPVVLNNGRGDVNCTGLSLCATDDGGAAFAYSATSADGTHLVTHLERLDKDGQPLWEQPVVVEPAAATNRPFVVNNKQNEVMVLYADADVQYNARVFDAEGNDVWGESVPVYSGGYSDGLRIYPSIDVQPGPDGGVFFCVMDGGWDGRLVYLTRDGQYGFPTANMGTRVSGSDYQCTKPSVYYNPADKMIYTSFATMSVYGQDGYGVHAQKFSLSGQRQWGDDGICIEPVSTGQQTANTFVRASTGGRVAVFHQKQSGTAFGSPVGSYITLVDADGTILSEPKDFSTSAGVKNNFNVSPLIGDSHYIATWTEKRGSSTSECIYSQYVSADGSTASGIGAARRELSSATAGLETIGEEGFSYSDITSLTLPASVRTLEEGAFAGCKQLADLTLNEGLVTLGDRAFNSVGAQKITVPSTVKTIGSSAFEWCSSLATVELNDGLETICAGAFQSTPITEITIPEGITELGAGDGSMWSPSGMVFTYCEQLTTVHLPSTITSLGYGSFMFCPLTTLTIDAVEPPTIGPRTNPFDGDCYETCKLVVPEGSVDAYKETAVWSNFTNIEGSPTTAVKAVADRQPADSQYYDLGGRRKAASQKGLTISQGRKYVR